MIKASIFLAVAAVLGATVSAYVTPRPVVQKSATQLHETFDLGVGMDTFENSPIPLRGEAAYKEWVNKVKDDALLNRQYNVLRRVRELELLEATADAGILSKLEAQGLDLETIEKALPIIEELGLLSLVGNNQQLLINGVAPIVVEGAPFLLPLVAGALGVGPPAFYLGAAVCGGLELFLVLNNVEIPLVGLPAGAVLGLLLVPLTIVLTAVGTSLASLQKKIAV